MEDSNHTDVRIVRTYELLTDAFFKLSETRSIDSIKVREICDLAMVHRATFYNHFSDKDEFLNFIISSTLSRIYDSSVQQYTSGDSRSFARILLTNLVGFAEQHKRLVLDFTAEGDGYIHGRLYNFYIKELNAMIVPEICDIPNRKQYEEAFCHFIAGGSLSLIRWWLSGGYEYSDKEQLVDRILFVLKSLLTIDGR